MAKTFINLENGKLCLYDLKVGKKAEEVRKLILNDSPREFTEIEFTSFGIREGQIFNGNKMARFISCKRTGEVIQHNDFYSEDEDVYRETYYLYDLIPLYLTLQEIEKGQFKSLESLAQYTKIEGEEISNKLFKKYRKLILSTYKLDLLMQHEDLEETKELIRLLTLNAKCDLKNKFKNIEEYFDIYRMNLNGLTIADKTKMMKR